MSERKIAPITDNLDKQQTYRYQMSRYSKALREGFFFEAMLIDYAMLEDRLLAILYHAAFFADRDKTKCWKRTKPYFQHFVSTFKKEKENDTLGVKNISGKIKIIRSMLLWASETDGGYENDRYLIRLKSQCECMDIGALLETLNAIEQWCEYRNEIVHALLNKQTASVYSELKIQVENGMKYARIIDSQVRLMKKGNLIRRAVNASMR